MPAGAVLRLADGTAVEAGADGLHRIDATRLAGVTLTLPRDSDEAATLSIRMTLEDTGGARLEIGGTMLVEAAGVADAPLLVVRDIQAPGHAGADSASGWVPLPVEAALADTDGSERLWLWLRDLPAGFTLSAGHPAGTDSWLVPAEAIPGLAIRPPAGFTGGRAAAGSHGGGAGRRSDSDRRPAAPDRHTRRRRHGARRRCRRRPRPAGCARHPRCSG
ncbi:hypothetical protein ACFQU7_15910 [Pseudoroseomonas wenyumeiae]